VGARHRSPGAAFTLVELLTVVAILAVLASIGFPTLMAARSSAAKARTRSQFTQWTLACAQFRQEYGFFPSLGTDHRLATVADTAGFIRALTGRNPDGSVVADPADLGGNTRRLRFISLAESDLVEGRLVDAFGNVEFGFLRDQDADGVIRPGVDGEIAAVAGVDGNAVVPAATAFPAMGIRAGVAFFSAGRGTSAEDCVMSWR
jgi:prepilin-type N-terminal cleavage/methylation domain-containing protein